MTATCQPASSVPDFGRAVKARASSALALLGDGDPPTCATTLNATDAAQCANFTTWTQYTAAFCGAVATAASLVEQYVTDTKIQGAIYNALKALYVGVQGVNLQFMAAISDINAGTPYAPIPTPDPVPPFPPPTDANHIGDAVASAWEILKPFLEKMIGEMPTGSPWIKVLEGVIESSDQIVASIQALFASLSGK